MSNKFAYPIGEARTQSHYDQTLLEEEEIKNGKQRNKSRSTKAKFSYLYTVESVVCLPASAYVRRFFLKMFIGDLHFLRVSSFCQITAYQVTIGFFKLNRAHK